MDGLVTSIADVTFFAGLINDDNKFEVEFAAKLLPVDEIKYDRTIEDADKISIVVKPYRPLRNLFCTPSQYLKGNLYIRIEGYLREPSNVHFCLVWQSNCISPLEYTRSLAEGSQRIVSDDANNTPLLLETI